MGMTRANNNRICSILPITCNVTKSTSTITTTENLTNGTESTTLVLTVQARAVQSTWVSSRTIHALPLPATAMEVNPFTTSTPVKTFHTDLQTLLTWTACLVWNHKIIT